MIGRNTRKLGDQCAATVRPRNSSATYRCVKHCDEGATFCAAHGADYQERIAIRQHLGGFAPAEAEQLAAQDVGQEYAEERS